MFEQSCGKESVDILFYKIEEEFEVYPQYVISRSNF